MQIICFFTWYFLNFNSICLSCPDVSTYDYTYDRVKEINFHSLMCYSVCSITHNCVWCLISFDQLLVDACNLFTNIVLGSYVLQGNWYDHMIVLILVEKPWIILFKLIIDTAKHNYAYIICGVLFRQYDWISTQFLSKRTKDHCMQDSPLVHYIS